MAQRHPKPSSERRGNKHPGTNGPSRGGIQKRPGGRGGRDERGGRGGRVRRGGLYRSDRDGDLEMSTGEGDESGHGRGQNQGGARSDTRHDTPHRAFTKRLEQMVGDQIDRKAGGPLEELTIHGWRQSKVVQDLKQGQAIWKTREWLEKKAGNLNGIKKHRIEGELLILSVEQDTASAFLRLNGYSFGQAAIKIEKRNGQDQFDEALDEQSNGLWGKMKIMLSRRYNEEQKFLDLSDLQNDTVLESLGMMIAPSKTKSKFFPALMKVCNAIFVGEEEKKVSVQKVSLANNKLVNVSHVTALSQTFPALLDLDLSNNALEDMSSMEAWRWKFRYLDCLTITGNLVDAPINLNEFLHWYPTLRTLNGQRVRSDQDAEAAVVEGSLPLPVYQSVFSDEDQIAEKFLKEFFPLYDNDREALVSKFYDAQSSFSFSVNTSAPRDPSDPQAKVPPWDAYIKKSRNLTKLTHLPTKMARFFKGADQIRDIWLTLPRTAHPSLDPDPAVPLDALKWSVDCHAIPGLPDPSGQSPSGVGGLLIVAHGERDEMDEQSQARVKRSFDRTFILGPGEAFKGVRVISDVLLLRAYGGFQGWQNKSSTLPGQLLLENTPGELQVPQSIPQDSPVGPDTILPPDGWGVAQFGKPDEVLQKEKLATDLSIMTRLKLYFAGQLMNQTEWDLAGAMSAFNQAKTAGLVELHMLLPTPL